MKTAVIAVTADSKIGVTARQKIPRIFAVPYRCARTRVVAAPADLEFQQGQRRVLERLHQRTDILPEPLAEVRLLHAVPVHHFLQALARRLENLEDEREVFVRHFYVPIISS